MCVCFKWLTTVCDKAINHNYHLTAHKRTHIEEKHTRAIYYVYQVVQSC